MSLVVVEIANFNTVLSVQGEDEMGEVIEEKSESLLLNILLAEIVQQLKQNQSAIAHRFDQVAEILSTTPVNGNSITGATPFLH